MKNIYKLLTLTSVIYVLSILTVSAIDCNSYPFEDRIVIAEYCGYHKSDDKSAFWIPMDVNPVMMTDYELEKYRIYNNIESCSKDPFCQYYIKKAQQENRPLIRSDIDEARGDNKRIYFINGLYYSLTDRNGILGHLDQKQEKELKELQNKYGENSEVFDKEFKRKLALYRARQEQVKINHQIALTNAMKAGQLMSCKKLYWTLRLNYNSNQIKSIEGTAKSYCYLKDGSTAMLPFENVTDAVTGAKYRAPKLIDFTGKTKYYPWN